MNIKSIQIKNFRSIKEINLDFSINKNGSEKNIMLGRYKSFQDGNTIIPYATILMGRNAAGKTTILNALGLIAEFYNGNVSGLIMQALQKQMIIEETDDIIASGGSVTDFDESAKISTIVNQKIKEGLEQSKPEITNKHALIMKKMIHDIFMSNSLDSNKDIEFKIVFITKNGLITNLYKIEEEGLFTSNINFSGIVNEKNHENIQNDLADYWKNATISEIRYLYSPQMQLVMSSYMNPANNNHLSFMFNLVLDLFGQKKLLTLMQLADPRITSLKVITDPKGNEMVTNIFINGKSKNIWDISDGTKKFISINSVFAKAIKNKSSLIMLDEIEIQLHMELVNAIKIIMINLFDKYGIQTIFTTHNPLTLNNHVSYAQVFSIEANDGEYKAVKLSTIMKPGASATNKYSNQFFAAYPDTELLRNKLAEVY